MARWGRNWYFSITILYFCHTTHHILLCTTLPIKDSRVFIVLTPSTFVTGGLKKSNKILDTLKNFHQYFLFIFSRSLKKSRKVNDRWVHPHVYIDPIGQFLIIFLWKKYNQTTSKISTVCVGWYPAFIFTQGNVILAVQNRVKHVMVSILFNVKYPFKWLKWHSEINQPVNTS